MPDVVEAVRLLRDRAAELARARLLENPLFLDRPTPALARELLMQLRLGDLGAVALLALALAERGDARFSVADAGRHRRILSEDEVSALIAWPVLSSTDREALARGVVQSTWNYARTRLGSSEPSAEDLAEDLRVGLNAESVPAVLGVLEFWLARGELPDGVVQMLEREQLMVEHQEGQRS